jgi:hypothetical protein
MAQTYTIPALGISILAGKSLVGLYNGTGSGRIVRLYRAWVLNNQVAAVAGTISRLELRIITTGSGGTAITPVKHDSLNENFPAQIVTSTNMSYTNSDLVLRTLWSSDEPAQATSSADELETIPALNIIWDVEYHQSTVEPIVCREGYGVSLNNIDATTGIVDVFFEVTLASS